jgi:hypothetical protein
VNPSTDPPPTPKSDLPVTVIQPPGAQTAPPAAGSSSEITRAYGEAVPPPPGPAPARIGKYEIVRTLGDGGQATAYLAVDPDLKRQVVLKLYHAARTPGEQDMILKEGQALARVRSGYVAQCHSAERHDGVPYLVMEYIPGRTLADAQRSRPPDLDRSLELIEQLAEGLAAVHACGLLHRDIKPSNVIVGDDGVPRLVDFGLAEPLASAALSRVSGTIPYMAPEQARGDRDRIGPRTDLFALGAVLYELLTGRPPYQGTTRQELMQQACEGTVVPPRERNPKVPAAVNDVCVRCLAKDPADRFASAAELAEAVRGCRPRRGWRGLDLVFGLGRFKFRLAIGATVALILLLLTPLAFWPGRAPRRQDVVALKTEPPFLAPAPRSAPEPSVAPAPLEEKTLPAFEMKPMAVASKLARSRHPVGGRELARDFALRVKPAHGTFGADGTWALKPGDALALTVEPERAAYLGVWFARQDGIVVQLFPNDHEPDALAPAGRPRPVPGRAEKAPKVERAAAGLEYLQVRAATRRWEAPRPSASRSPFPLFTTPQDEKAIRAFLQQPLRLDEKPGAGAAPPAVSEVVVPVRVR